ncbi:MAG TPA: hypothetical protein EYQ24_02800 [Bacteroidetes bacterium]|nr:hypothetical protein [Bacteroidota bacterium]HIL58566.1 hypothetical protein [Rhodothermales bacterium]
MLKKGLFKTAAPPAPPPDAAPPPPAPEGEASADFEALGFARASNMQGSMPALLVCLRRLYEEFLSEVSADDAARLQAQAERDAQLAELRGKRDKHRATVQALRETKVPKARESVERLRDEIRATRENPAAVREEAPSKASYWIGVLILACLTVYLLVFYSSASYSAFFREFGAGEIGVANAIFDAQAFANAFQHGLAELVLIAMMPFVFLGLGFLIHKFQQQEGVGKYLKVGALVGVTFLFDAILAYEITHKIADLQAQMAFQTPEPYALADAAQNVQFWLIIFAGFIVYLIWGFVFDFTIEEHEKLDAVRLAIRSKQDEVRHIEGRIAEDEKRADTLELAVANLTTEIGALEAAPLIVSYNPKAFKDRIGQFMEGWVHYLKANKHPDSAVDEAVGIRDAFLARALTQAPESGDGALPSAAPHLDL